MYILLIKINDLVIEVLMLTLQNEPPTIDTSAEIPDQYKNYSKTFRKMVSECLKREPDQRPTAKQLLRHEFFKKAKVNFYFLCVVHYVLEL